MARRSIITEDDIARIRLRLVADARLFDDPQSYIAGVEDALAEVLDRAGSTTRRRERPREEARML